MIAPIISSLDELNVSIPDDARNHLENQLLHLYSFSDTSSLSSSPATTTTTTPTTAATNSHQSSQNATSHMKAKEHLNDILQAMKLSPQITLCRVNLILSTREDVILELKEILAEWKEQRLKMIMAMNKNSYKSRKISTTTTPTQKVHVDGCVMDPQSINPNENQGISLHIDPHPIFDDCIEIKWCNDDIQKTTNKEGQGMHSDNSKIHPSTKVTKGLVLSTEYRQPPQPFSTFSSPSFSTSISSSSSTSTANSHSIQSLTDTKSFPDNNNHHNQGVTSIRMSIEKRTKRHQLGWPDSHRVVICDRLCGEAVLRGSDIFVRGILCADSGIRAGEEVAVYADLTKNISRGLLLEHYNGNCVFLGTGITGCTRAEMFHKTQGIGVYMSKGIRVSTSDFPPLNGVLAHKILLQNLPSVLVGYALDPKCGEVLLDMCCAPGGKTSHLASLVKNDALIVACDKSRKKVLAVREKMKEKGATCVVPLAVDSTHLVVEDGSLQKHVKEIISNAKASPKDGLLDIKGFYPESFDRILLDPPCSALGLRPKLLVQTTARELLKHANFQKRFVRKAISLLKPGGTLTYSTCTFNATENEDMVRHILDEHPCMKLVPIHYDIGCAGLPGRGLNDVERGMVRRFDPIGEDDTMGFFVGKFIKDESILVEKAGS